MLDWVIAKLNKLNYFLTNKKYKKYCTKRDSKIERLTTDLWRESAVFRVRTDELKYVQEQFERSGKKYVWIVEYYDEHLNCRRR